MAVLYVVHLTDPALLSLCAHYGFSQVLKLMLQMPMILEYCQ